MAGKVTWRKDTDETPLHPSKELKMNDCGGFAARIWE